MSVSRRNGRGQGKKEITKQKLYGILGEAFTEAHLKESMEKYTRADDIDHIGFSLLYRGKEKLFDFHDFTMASSFCREYGKCEIPTSEKPCFHKEFYCANHRDDWWVNFPYTGDNRYRPYCSVTSTEALLNHYGKINLPEQGKFIADYLACHNFIVNLYQNEDFLTEREREKGRSLWSTHPGRIDYFGFREGNYYCIDSKVNTSKLSLWQKVRFAWMHSEGHKCQIYNVSFKPESFDELMEIYRNLGIPQSLEYLSPSISVIDIDPREFTEAQDILKDRERFLFLARTQRGLNIRT